MSESLRSLAFTLATRTTAAGELATWRRLGVRPRIWWRDDDARRPSTALDRLLATADGRPLALAVIPDGDLAALRSRLASQRNISIGQHGVDHVNRRSIGAPSEYTASPSIAEMRTWISAGRTRMLEAGLSPSFYTPPWNAVDAGLAPALAAIGFPLLSAGATQGVHSDLAYASAEIDVLSWKRGGVFRGARRVMSSLDRALKDRRLRGELERPIGLLTHHLDHDEPTWRFLERALAWFDGHFDWTAVERIATERSAAGEAHKSSRAPLAMAHPSPVW